MKGAAGRRGPDAALVVLPGQGLRLADDALRAAGSSTGRSTRSGSAAPATATPPSGWSMSYLWLPYMIMPDLRRARADPELAAHRLRGPRRAARGTTFRRVILPLVFPAVVAGSIFTFSLTLGDYITPVAGLARHPVHRQRRLRQHHQQPAARLGVRDGPDRGHGRLPADRPAARSVRAPMRLSRRSHEPAARSASASRSRSSTSR